jgi:hypothetical protein
MRRWQGWRWGVAVALSAGVLLAMASGLAGAAEAPPDTRPERGIAVYAEYSGVVVPVSETVRLELTVANEGRRDDASGDPVDLMQEGPPPIRCSTVTPPHLLPPLEAGHDGCTTRCRRTSGSADRGSSRYACPAEGIRRASDAPANW